MENKIWKRMIALLLVISLFGCSSSAGSGETAQPQNTQATTSEEDVTISEEDINGASVVEGAPAVSEASSDASADDDLLSEEDNKTESADENKTNEYGLSKQQMNSFSMLYYLAITAEDIRTEKNNRLALEDINTSLLNDINPGAIDEITQDHLRSLRDIIASYIDTSIKRDRLQYIYNQAKAAAIRSAVPNPLDILAMVNSPDWKKLALSTVYTIVDSYTNYKNTSDAADREFLISGWELDDEETETIRKNRDRAFDYMVDIVQQYGIDGKLTLNERAIEDFAKICDIESTRERIRRLESEKKTYKMLGNYWLELASSYFDVDEYENCLDCVDEYNNLATGIYRKDSNYAKILPMAIVAAQNVYTGNDYITRTGAFADSLIDNTATGEWSLRYFAAQVYMDLYLRSNDNVYLDKAYEIAYDNVTILLSEQRSINSVFLSEVKKIEAEEPDYKYMTEDEKKEAKKEYKAEEKRVKEYNKALEKTRKTELPTMYEPLVVNCELLFALANEKGISSSDKKEIEEILQTEKNGIFLSDIANDRFSFSDSIKEYNIELSKDEIIIPVSVLLEGAMISASIKDGDTTTVIDDYKISKVDRNGKSIDTFLATYTSKKMKSYKWTSDSKIAITIEYGQPYDSRSFDFVVSEYDDKGPFPDKVVFEQK